MPAAIITHQVKAWGASGFSFAAFGGLAIGMSVFAAEGRDKFGKGETARTISVNELKDGHVTIIGQLGVALGTIVEIEARIIEYKEVPGKPVTQYVLEIERIDGRGLVQKKVMPFTVLPQSAARVAPSPGALDALVRDLTTAGARMKAEKGEVFAEDPISVAEGKALREGYVGSKHRLVVSDILISP